VILSGTLATEFAHSEGFPRFDPRTREKVEAWLDIIAEFKKKSNWEQIFHVDRYMKEGKHNLGTVGCVAIDADRRIAAGTSTGGRRMNVPGRVGDSGIIGAGTYCCPHGGISCTGVGEKIMVLSMAKEVANFLRFNRDATAQDAVDHGMAELSAMGGDGGLICIDAHGNTGYGFNTRGMTMHCIQ
jgi:beta-aspartyl-peptidase (threonine type)